MTIKTAQARVLHADCLDAMRDMEADSIDAIVTDPPYGLAFMGKGWDHGVPGVEFWTEALRVAKPGAHLVAFGGTRTFHRLACAIEDAGWEVRDCLSWLYGSGFPKSLDVSKAIDRRRDDSADIYRVTSWIRTARDAAGVTNAQIDAAFGFAGMAGHWTSAKSQPAVPTLDQVPMLLDALRVAPDDVPEDIRRLLWDLNWRKGQPGENWSKREVIGASQASRLAVAPGQGHERPEVDLPITAPATDAARQWSGWGTALKPAWEPIILARKPLVSTVASNVLAHGTGALNIDGCRIETADSLNGGAYSGGARPTSMAGQTGEAGGTSSLFEAGGGRLDPSLFVQPSGRWPANVTLDEEAAAMLGEPSRFFYVAKASRSERGEGNTHPTVKPIALMRWLVKLVCPPGGTILDPFAGSGTTLLAAQSEGFDAIGIEREAEYVEIIKKRIA